MGLQFGKIKEQRKRGAPFYYTSVDNSCLSMGFSITHMGLFRWDGTGRKWWYK